MNSPSNSNSMRLILFVTMKAIIICVLLALLCCTATSALHLHHGSAEEQVKKNPKTLCLNYINGAVKQFGRSKCDTFDSEADWYEFCNATTQTVQTCPKFTVGDRTDFFHRHCALDLIVRKLNDLEQAHFRTRATAIATVELVFEKRIESTEICGTSPSSYCRRDIKVCDRSENPRGICVSPRTLCASHAHPERCLASRAPISVFKTDLMTFLNEIDWIERPLGPTDDLLDEKRAPVPVVSEKPMEEHVEQSSSILVGAVVASIIVCCVLLVVAISVVSSKRCGD